MMPFSREGIEVEALRTDRYLEALLAERDRATEGGDTPEPGVREAHAGGSGTAFRSGRPRPGVRPLDPELVSTIASLDRALVRVHPSFRFEERLARRLAETADAMRVSEAAGAEGATVPIALPFDPALDPADPALAGSGPGLPAVPRPLLIGALSLAGAAIVAWRFGRPVDPMTRAVRAAHQVRLGGRPSAPRAH